MSRRRCAHILTHVHDLHEAVRDLTAAGFDVTYASDPETAQNAHVWFSEGPIIEIVTTPRRAALLRPLVALRCGYGGGARMMRWARSGEGFCDLAVVADTDDLGAELRELRRLGCRTGKAVPWTRTRADGERVEFAFGYPSSDRVPFLTTPYRPDQHPARTSHANGATGVTRIGFGVAPEEREAVRLVIPDDPIVQFEESLRTGVRWVEMAGLKETVDPLFSHGAVFRPEGE
ncbi:VOC family protein [Streptomyces sp. NPDC005438]|uniref:VOC family protein n=1 Tax=Streptomyces sp. NPDC005438 TaxID=3156880 RepID=UPI0033A133D5